MEIPVEAWQPIPRIAFELIGEIDQWYCPDCGASGKGFEGLDYYNNSSSHFEYRETNRTDKITLCCGTCFEEHIYITNIR